MCGAVRQPGQSQPLRLTQSFRLRSENLRQLPEYSGRDALVLSLCLSRFAWWSGHRDPETTKAGQPDSMHGLGILRGIVHELVAG